MKKSLIGIALLTTMVSAQPEKLVIGAWNIEWLGAPHMRSGPSKGVLQSAQDLADVIRASGADILSLEEISDNPATEFDPDNPVVAEALALLSKGQDKPWKYMLFPKKDDSLDQFTGIAWNSARVSAIDGPFHIPLSDATEGEFKLWKRWPCAMKFRAGEGKTDFVLIPMHLKSNRKDERFDDPPRQRAQETGALMQVLGSVRKRFSDRDVVLLGDTNCLKAREQAIRNIVRGGYRDLNPKDMRTTWKGPAPFDRIFVPIGQGEFKNSRETVFKPASMTPQDFKVRCSDHYLVTTEIEVLQDDD